MRLRPLPLFCLGLMLSAGAQAAPAFVNGLTLPGDSLDLSVGSDTERRVGFFSDLYYDPNRNEWWGLSDRGPGGGTLNYETRVQRFSLDVDPDTGAIANFQIAQTIKFSAGGSAMDGLAPVTNDMLGNAFDPEGLVINPKNGHLLVSDEYGPSLYEFDRDGQLVKPFTVPTNLVPGVGSNVNYNAAPPTLTSGREPNRGAEGLAISPDGNYAYLMLQNGTIQDGWSSSSRGQYTRIVKFDTATGQAVGQYAYKLESAGQGRGISAIVAINDHQFMVLERNNRGIGVGATLNAADKNVFMIDLTGAADVTGVNLPASGVLAGAVSKNATKFLDLDVTTLAALGNISPEKWEGLTIGPRLNDGGYLLLAGTDNDYSVTQNGTGVQFDVWFNINDVDPYASSIQCPIGSTSGCFLTSTAQEPIPTPASLTQDHQLLPGVLHAYKASAADLAGYAAPVPEPETYALMLAGLGLVGFAARRQGRCG